MPIVLTISLARAFGVNKESKFEVSSLSSRIKKGAGTLEQ